MYKSPKYHQISFYDFNQSCGLQLDETNEWVVLADHMEWEKMEEESGYAKNFPSTTGRPAKPFRMVLGALVIQKHKNLSDRKLVKEIAENPYLQYFIGCGSYQKQCPFKASALVSFRQRIDAVCLMEVNEIFLETGAETPEHAEKGKRKKTSEETKEGENAGTAILDATCSPSRIKYPQDFALLNEGRRKLETMIDFFHKEYHPWKKPRSYRRVAQQSYLSLAKSKKRTVQMSSKILHRWQIHLTTHR